MMSPSASYRHALCAHRRNNHLEDKMANKSSFEVTYCFSGRVYIHVIWVIIVLMLYFPGRLDLTGPLLGAALSAMCIDARN